MIQLFSKSWSGPGLKALVAHRSGRNPLPAAFFRGEFKKQSGGLFFEEGRFFAKKRALSIKYNALFLAAFRRQQAISPSSGTYIYSLSPC
ncbi:MAG: hypothetical protein IJ055_00465 [Oscillospiraceae bacterium]|nr:hypothetical protein [Oscillospiraceae bacterium]